MNELIEAKWYLDETGKKIVTDSMDKYQPPLTVLAVSGVPVELLGHICHVHNEWLEDQWAAERFYQSLESDDR
jgi:hypothetical protein